MNEKDYRYVAHLDILGMSAIVDKNAEEAWELISDLVSVRDKTQRYEIEFTETNERFIVLEQIKVVTFSDTILLFTKANSVKELHCMIILLTEIFHKALCKCIPVRIGLSYGKFFFNLEKSMYAGPALIDAYHTGEKPQWLGITLSESVYKLAINLQLKTGKSDIIIPWEIPLKNEIKKGYVINWPVVFSHDLKVAPPISVEQFYQAFESTFGKFETLRENDQIKYQNTVKFMNHQLNCHLPNQT